MLFNMLLHVHVMLHVLSGVIPHFICQLSLGVSRRGLSRDRLLIPDDQLPERPEDHLPAGSIYASSSRLLFMLLFIFRIVTDIQHINT